VEFEDAEVVINAQEAYRIVLEVSTKLSTPQNPKLQLTNVFLILDKKPQCEISKSGKDLFARYAKENNANKTIP